MFPRMTCAENLDMGAFRFKTIDRADLDRVLELFPRLGERLQAAGAGRCPAASSRCSRSDAP